MIRDRLLRGDVLSLRFADGLGFDVWAEKYANPPRVYFEGRPLPLERLDDVVEKCGRYMEEEGVKVLWNGALPAKRPE